MPPSTARLVERHAHRAFVKELLFRSLDVRRLTQQFRLIQELRKRYRQREAQAAAEADLVTQDKLQKLTDQRAPRLSDLTMRPQMAGRKSTGVLEAHANGMRFTTKKQETCDVLYANVKHALFQPCENEVVVLIHFHLKNPIMIGKKKTSDVQFCTDVIDASVAIENSRRSMYDPDELDEEQRERTLRKRLNEAFKQFAKQIEKVAKHHNFNLEFDIPYRDLGFHGVPNREMVLVQPTVNCMVNLTEMPFFLIELDQIEHVHFERCTFKSSNFDMVVIGKDFEKPVKPVNAIPMAELDGIQEWLTDMGMTYTTGVASLNWKNIMNTVKQDEFFYEEIDEEGETKPAGWEFLRMDGGSDDEDEGDEEDEDFKAASESEESEEDDDDDDDDDEDDDASDGEGSEEEEEDDEDDDEEEEEEESEDDRPKKKKR